MAKARPDYPHYRVSERAKSISSHKGAEGNKLPPPSENGGQRLAACRRCCAMYRDCCHLVIHNIFRHKVKKSFPYLQIKVKKNKKNPELQKLTQETSLLDRFPVCKVTNILLIYKKITDFFPFPFYLKYFFPPMITMPLAPSPTR